MWKQKGVGRSGQKWSDMKLFDFVFQREYRRWYLARVDDGGVVVVELDDLDLKHIWDQFVGERDHHGQRRQHERLEGQGCGRGHRDEDGAGLGSVVVVWLGKQTS